MMKKIISLIIILLLFTVAIHAEDEPQQFHGFDLSGYGEDGQKTWDVKGDTADIEGSTVKIHNIIANTYGKEDGDDDMNVTAKKGTLNKDSGNMLLEEDVVITTESGAKLITDTLNWARKEDLVTTDDEVTITKETMVAVGKGVKAQPNLGIAQLNEDVTVTVDIESEKPSNANKMTITCDGPLVINYQEQTAVFNDNVVAVSGDGGRKLFADKAEVFFDTKTSKIKEMICTGNVSIFQGENASYSDKLIYKAAEQKVILLGRPKLIFYSGEGDDVPFGK